MATLLRKMPYDQLHGAHIGDDELFAATPNWIGHESHQPDGHGHTAHV
jgi:hypothetical protein